MTTQPDQYAVMGNPIAHSLSPRIHALFAAQTGQHLEYRAMLAGAGRLCGGGAGVPGGGGKGLNVTVLKQDALGVRRRAQRPRRAGRGGQYPKFWTDRRARRQHRRAGAGARSQVNHGCAAKGRRILLLGRAARRGSIAALAGGTAAARLVIANRTAGKAAELALRLAIWGRCPGCGFADLAGRLFDSDHQRHRCRATDAVPPLPDGVLATDGWCYDLMQAMNRPRLCAGGGSGAWFNPWMVLYAGVQAAQLLHLWRGVWPETKPVIAALRG